MTDDIRPLLDREEIRDVIFRYARGIDRRDFELVRKILPRFAFTAAPCTTTTATHWV